MKKLILLLCALLLTAGLFSCKKEELPTTDTSSQQIEEQEYSGAVYTVRVDREDGGYVLCDYREDGVLLEERLYYSYLKSKSLYGTDGNIKERTTYYPDGGIVDRRVYTMEGLAFTEAVYDKDGKYGGKTVTDYNVEEYISAVSAYDGNDVIIDSTAYIYNEGGVCTRSEAVEYALGTPCVYTNRNFNPQSGDVETEEIIEYTVDGFFVSHEVYRYTADDIILEGKYDEMGNPLPIEG